jgi:osmoprotectant transport system substrate-binding protein
MRRTIVLGSLGLALVACSAPPTSEPVDDRAITVGSFDFAESRLLAELYAQALERVDLPVRRQLGLGTRELVEPSLERGLIDLVPEYTGSLLTFLTASRHGDADESLQAALAERGLVALDPAPAQDRNVVVVTADTAEALSLRTVSDLAAVDERLTLGGPPECPDRPLCLPGLESAYGVSFRAFVPLDQGGRVTVEALRSNHVQAAVMFSSDGAIRANDLVVLLDDRRLQPAEHVTPVVRADVVARYGDRLVGTLNAISAVLTTEVLRTLNELVSIRGRPARVVVSEWLDAHAPGPRG